MATAEAEGISGGTSTDGTTAGDTGRACLSFRFAFLTFLFALAFFFGFIFLGKVSSCYRLLHTADKVLNVGPSHDLAIAGIGRDDRRENFAGTLLMCSAHIALRNLLYERKLQETPKSRDAYTTTGSEKELASQLGEVNSPVSLIISCLQRALIQSRSMPSFLQQRDISDERELFEIQLSKESESERFSKERVLLNEIVMKYADLPIKRFYSLDCQVYREGSLPAKTKQLLGLVASFVLRCDDCIRYHLIHCREKGVSDKELVEALAIGLVVGGSITIPHLRRAIRMWYELKGTLKRDSRHKHAALKS